MGDPWGRISATPVLRPTDTTHLENALQKAAYVLGITPTTQDPHAFSRPDLRPVAVMLSQASRLAHSSEVRRVVIEVLLALEDIEDAQTFSDRHAVEPRVKD